LVGDFDVKVLLKYELFLFSVSVAYSNQKRIDAEAKQLQTNAATFAKQTSQWLKLMEEFSYSLKVSYLFKH